MDPDVTLTRMLELAGGIERGDLWPDEAAELAELIQALDQWIRRGGFLPAPWQASRNALVKPMQEMSVNDLHARLDVLCDMVKAVSAAIAHRARC
jgi:hypothetical protein